MKKILLVTLVIIAVGGLYFFITNNKSTTGNPLPFFKVEGSLLPKESVSSIKWDDIRFAYEGFYNPKRISFDDFRSQVLSSSSFDSLIIGESHHEISEIAIAEKILKTVAEKREIAKLFEESTTSFSTDGSQGKEEGLLSQHSQILKDLSIPSETMGGGSINSTPFWPIIKDKIKPNEFYVVYVGKTHSSSVMQDLMKKYPAMFVASYPVDNPNQRPILDVAFKRVGKRPLVILLFGMNEMLTNVDHVMEKALDNPNGILESVYDAAARGEISSETDVYSRVSKLMPEVSKFVRTNVDTFIKEWSAGLGLNNAIEDSFFVALGDNVYAAIIARNLNTQSGLDPAWSIPYSVVLRKQIFSDPQYGGLLSRGEAVLGGNVSSGQKSITETQGQTYYDVKKGTKGVIWLDFHTGDLTLRLDNN